MVKVTREERQRRSALQPKCRQCPNCLSAAAIAEGRDLCDPCSDREELRRDMAFLRELRLQSEEIEERIQNIEPASSLDNR